MISSTGYEGRSETTAYGITEWACRVVCNSDQIDNFEFRAGANSMTSCGGFATSGFRTALCFETMPDIVELSKVQTEGFSDTPGLMKIIAPIPLGPDGINKEIPDNCFNVQTRVVAEVSLMRRNFVPPLAKEHTEKEEKVLKLVLCFLRTPP